MRKILLRMSTVAIAGSLLLAATACGRDEEALARKYGPTPAAAPETTAAASQSPGATPTATAPAATAPPSADPSATGSAPPSSAAPVSTTPLTRDQLASALVTAAEMPQGTYDTEPTDTAEDRATAQQADCQPLIDLLRPAQGATPPAASAQASVTVGSPYPTSFTVVELFSFADGGAADLFAKGRDALKTCASITSTDSEGATTTETYSEIQHAQLGDETLAVGMVPQDGGALGMVLVRVGSTLVVVSNAELSGTVPSLSDDAVVVRQVEKLVAVG
ncbi:hypothetical protein [Embleya sp. NBC_00896]|uniref:hypothetical protein n=1 Tax=Embleya sp. NBC_00896 TaxID=2975961 RepID=UPI00386EFD9F|nr:hypothetical protein OG928_22660 [Embleya sp. NBC_00896]